MKYENAKLYERVSAWMDAHQEEMVRDIQRLVRIPSVSAPQEGPHPFGEECGRALETMLQIGEEHGFYTENHEGYVGRIGSREKNWDNMIGLWNHLDVVLPGEDWIYAPFESVRQGSFLIGRGSQDNKGPAVGMLYVMECIRELGLDPGHELSLFVGCDEERGMADLEYYTSHYPTPALSIISDCGFPVCYGEKGILEGRIVSGEAFSSDILDFSGGIAGNIIPDRAVLTLRKDVLSQEVIAQLAAQPGQRLEAEQTEAGVMLIARGSGGHSAFPEGSSNAIQVLCEAVLEAHCLKAADAELIRAVECATRENYGEQCGIVFADEKSGRLTCVGTLLRTEEGHVSLGFNIRYPVTDSGERISRRMEQFWSGRGFRWELLRDSAPNYFDPQHPVAVRLTETFNRLTGEKRKPYAMGGGTYARKLPHALGFGIGDMPVKEKETCTFLPTGHGGAHGPDEALDLRALNEALKLYVCALVELGEISLA